REGGECRGISVAAFLGQIWTRSSADCDLGQMRLVGRTSRRTSAELLVANHRRAVYVIKYMGRLAILLVAAGLLVIGGGAAAVYAQTTSTVGMREFEFLHPNLTVSPGRVTFTLNNERQFSHNLHIEVNDVSRDVKSSVPV